MIFQSKIVVFHQILGNVTFMSLFDFYPGLSKSSVTLKSQINVRIFYISRKERDLLIVHEDVHKNKKKTLCPKTMRNH